ncbi:sigma-70 family RNA polymerase sigma factor [Daejeonella sp. H1SJ63]|jgi:RNA polymerase sigma-70 factor (ECF subfamily)|uniref:RNA polymerase sigma factor n=1 Tax=Daejeonella sp. H1SJ63 TaxID=3034145 RepID=UPI0023EDC7CE|nr:sigma-70 family RNA polymerase sigma factor [Daejeonella sp. H1SJ63]
MSAINIQTVSDQDLVHQYIQGHEQSLEELIRRHKSKIYTSIYLLVKDSYLAEDIFQDVFIKVINTLRAGRYNEEGKFLPWVIRIAHNMVIDHFRKEKRTPLVTTTEGFDIFEVLKFYDESAEDRLIRDQTHRDLRELIHHLPSEQKEVLIMRHYGDLSFKEIADITDVSINTALGRMRYALSNLRKMMLTKELSLKNI